MLSFFCLSFAFTSCAQQQVKAEQVDEQLTQEKIQEQSPLRLGAERTEVYLPLLKEKRVALVVNQTSMIGQTHLVDSLIALGVDVQLIFSPEHGFRGEASAGETIKNGKDKSTGLPILSLYGKTKRPSKSQLENIDIILFDIQDVGARFYTYISTMHEVMEAAAEFDKTVVVLDRPNPNGHYIDGPVRQEGFESFVGKHPIPVVHGLTVGELATMINGEGWLTDRQRCKLQVVTCEGYTHDMKYSLPVRPSPNLPNDRAIALYPSLCFFEGTVYSAGRGTDMPFQVAGHPDHFNQDFSFYVTPNEGAKHPKFKNQTCYGFNFQELTVDEIRAEGQLNLQPLIEAYSNFKDKNKFFLNNDFIDLLAGTNQFQKKIRIGLSEEAIRATWIEDLNAYKAMRKKYLLYK